MFKGAFTALVTPFSDGQIDTQALRDHVDFQIEKGIDGLVPCGTTGEASTLSHDELLLIHRKVAQNFGAVFVDNRSANGYFQH